MACVCWELVSLMATRQERIRAYSRLLEGIFFMEVYKSRNGVSSIICLTKISEKNNLFIITRAVIVFSPEVKRNVGQSRSAGEELLSLK